VTDGEIRAGQNRFIAKMAVPSCWATTSSSAGQRVELGVG
jgi:hypothetical protein